MGVVVLDWIFPQLVETQWVVRPSQPTATAAVISVGATSARGLSFDDALTALGVDNVQDAIVALYALIGATPPAPTPVLLSGALSGSSALAGALAVTRALSGQVAGSGALTAALTVEREGLSGSVIAAGLLTGSLEVTRALVGAVEGASAVVGALEVTRALSAALGGSGVVTGVLTVQRLLTGSVYGMGALTGDLTVEEAPGPSVTYLPSSPAPQLAYSTERLWEAYTGPILRGVRASDSATLDFPAGADGAIDMSGFEAFQGASAVTSDRWYEQAYVVNGGSVGVNDAVQTTAANRPRLRSANAMRGKQTITTGLQANGQVSANVCYPLPSVSNTRRSVTRMWVGSLIGGTFNSIGIWGIGTSADAFSNISLLYDTTGNRSPILTLDNAFQTGSSGPPTAQLAVFTYISSGTNRQLYINGQLAFSVAAATDIALTGGWIGRGSWSSSTNGPAEFGADLLWSSPLSDADRTAFESVLAQRFGITYAPFTKLVSYDGHSLIAGMNESGYFQNLQRQINNAWSGSLPRTPNYGVAGQTALQIYNRRAATATGAAASTYAKRAHVAMVATNSIQALASGSIVGGGTTIFNTDVLPYIQYMKTTGGFGSNVVMLTECPRTWTGTTTDVSQKEAERLVYNQLLKDNAAAEGYTVVDWGGLPEMTTGVPAGGNPNPPNPTNYGVSSGVHPNPAGYALCKALLQPVLEGMLA